MKKNRFFISLEEAQHICDKSQYDESSFWERIKLNIRYLWCKFTRQYVKKNQALSDAIEESDIQCLTPEEFYELKEQFNTNLQNKDQAKPE